MLEPYGAETKGGFSNHGPMAAEAMCSMGRGDAVRDWVHQYRKILSPRVNGHRRIEEAHWRDALGHFNRIGDWTAYFDNELAEKPWAEVLDRWLERLAPGFAAAAAHGVIRTGHAVRALTDADTPARRRELADGLAYWAASFILLPGHHSRRPHGTAKPSEAIERVKLLPIWRRRWRHSLTSAMGQLNRFEPFAQTFSMVDTGADSNLFISDLSSTFATVFLANARTAFSAISFIHAVTGPVALRPMVPYVSKHSMATALRYAWQTSAALYSRFAISAQLADPDKADLEGDNQMIERAIESGDEHAIKFTDACLNEYRLNPRGPYRAAAQQAIQLLSR